MPDWALLSLLSCREAQEAGRVPGVSAQNYQLRGVRVGIPRGFPPTPLPWRGEGFAQPSPFSVWTLQVASSD